MNQPVPGPRPGPAAPAGPDLDALRTAFDDLLDDSAPSASAVRAAGAAPGPSAVTDDQVDALARAHALLSEALESLDRGR